MDHDPTAMDIRPARFPLTCLSHAGFDPKPTIATVFGVVLLVTGFFVPPWIRLNPALAGHDAAQHPMQHTTPIEIVHGQLVVALCIVLLSVLVVTGTGRIWAVTTVVVGSVALAGPIGFTLVFDVLLATGRPFSRIPHNGWYISFLGAGWLVGVGLCDISPDSTGDP